MITVGITGGIGSGKSYVASLIASNYHIPVYDCDREARRLMLRQDLRTRLVAAIGPEAYAADGSLDKAVVAAYLFASPEHAAVVNGIVHPAVKADFMEWAACRAEPVVLMESAILIEAGFRDAVDRVVLVDAPVEIRLHRAMQRDHASAEQVRARMARQAATDDLLPYADLVVMNDGQPIMPQLIFFMSDLFAQSEQKA